MKKITKTIKKIQNKPENEKVRIMWILVIFCMIVMIGIWKINLDSNKSTKISSPNFNNLAVPSFPKLEEKLGELNEGIDSVEKLNEKDSESFENSESGKKVGGNKRGEELEN